MFEPCTEMWGSAALREALPGVVTYRDVTYVPYKYDGVWGIFDADGQAVEGSVDLHGPDGVVEHQILDWNGAAKAEAEEDVYVYAGKFTAHYGHFLINTLSRLWPLALGAPAGRLLFHGGGGPADWFALPFARDCLGALGLSAGEVRHFTVPTRIKTLIVPRTSFQEQHFVHRIYAALGHLIGARLLQDYVPRMGLPPAYLSKTGLRFGVGCVINEDIIEARLRAAGVDIIHPETLSLAQQIAVFVERPAVLGIAGSAFHTSVFAPPKARLLLLSPGAGPNSNYHLVDAANGNDALYIHGHGDTTEPRPGDNFLNTYYIPEPELAADYLLQQIGAVRDPPAPAVAEYDPGQVRIFSAR